MLIIVMKFIIYERHFRIPPKYVYVWGKDYYLRFIDSLTATLWYRTAYSVIILSMTTIVTQNCSKLLGGLRELVLFIRPPLQMKILVHRTVLPDLSASMSDFLLRMPQPTQSQWWLHQQ